VVGHADIETVRQVRVFADEQLVAIVALAAHQRSTLRHENWHLKRFADMQTSPVRNVVFNASDPHWQQAKVAARYSAVWTAHKAIVVGLCQVRRRIIAHFGSLVWRKIEIRVLMLHVFICSLAQTGCGAFSSLYCRSLGDNNCCDHQPPE
jgi:hypothetical protein